MVVSIQTVTMNGIQITVTIFLNLVFEHITHWVNGGKDGTPSIGDGVI